MPHSTPSLSFIVGLLPISWIIYIHDSTGEVLKPALRPAHGGSCGPGPLPGYVVTPRPMRLTQVADASVQGQGDDLLCPRGLPAAPALSGPQHWHQQLRGARRRSAGATHRRGRRAGGLGLVAQRSAAAGAAA